MSIEPSDDSRLQPQARELLSRLEAVPLSDHASPLAFESRLADDNGWTLGYAQRVVGEYRRFLVLTQQAGHTVCPSEEVDAAWHLHLTQTRAYAQLCTDVFGRFLHHDPSRGGPAERERHRQMYASTCEAYQRLFGAPPPADAWPDVDTRFGPPEQAGPRPDPRGAMPLLRLPTLLNSPRRRAVGAAALALGLGWWLGRSGWLNAWTEVPGRTVIELYGAALLVVALGLRREWWVSTPAPPRQVATLDPYEAAWLQGGRERVAATAIAEGKARRWFWLAPVRDVKDKITGAVLHRSVSRQDVPAAGLHPVLEGVLAQGPSSSPEPVGPVAAESLRLQLASACQPIERRLGRAGLSIQADELPRWRVMRWLLAAGLLAAASARLAMGLSLGRPVGFLAMLMLVNYGVLAAMANAPRTTPWGQLVLDALRRSLAAGRTPWPPADDEPATRQRALEALPMSFAVLGTAAVVADPEFAGINFAIEAASGARTGDTQSAAGCAGGGCGGGGCGGGCGG